MRVASPWALISLGLLFGACSDESPSPVVNDDINWLLGCERGQCGSGLTTHDQALDPEMPFTVTCGKNGAYFDLSVRDPGRSTLHLTPEGVEVPARNPSTLRVTNISNSGGCDVELQEQDVGASGPIRYQAKCGEGCELDVLGAQDNWDFVGELICDGLTALGNTAESQPRYNLKQVGGKPVVIKVGNCD